METNVVKESAFKKFFVSYSRVFTPVLAIAVLLLGWFFILAPKYNQVKISGVLNLESKNAELRNKETYLKQLKELSDNYKNLSARNISRSDIALPLEEDLAGLFVELEEIAKTSGFDILAVDMNTIGDLKLDAKSKGKVKEINVALTLRGGGYQALKNFLREVESNLRLFDVRSLNFSSAGDLYTLSFSTYYYLPQ